MHLMLSFSAICKRCRLVLGKGAPDKPEGDTAAKYENQEQQTSFCSTGMVKVSHKVLKSVGILKLVGMLHTSYK